MTWRDDAGSKAVTRIAVGLSGLLINPIGHVCRDSTPEQCHAVGCNGPDLHVVTHYQRADGSVSTVRLVRE